MGAGAQNVPARSSGRAAYRATPPDVPPVSTASPGSSRPAPKKLA